jgi:group I intron endonuclease
MKYLVYKITNLVNGKLYFGITKCTLKKRWNEHKHSSLKNKKNTHLCLAIKKYGINNFVIELIRNCVTEQEMYNLEIDLIKAYRTNEQEYGYNNSKGGEYSSFGKTVSNETRLIISKYQKERKRKPHSIEAKANMRIAAKGRDMTIPVLASAKLRKGKPAQNVTPVYSINSNGIEIKYRSLTDASKQTGILITSICNNLKNLSKTAGGLIWHYQHGN